MESVDDYPYQFVQDTWHPIIRVELRDDMNKLQEFNLLDGIVKCFKEYKMPCHLIIAGNTNHMRLEKVLEVIKFGKIDLQRIEIDISCIYDLSMKPLAVFLKSISKCEVFFVHRDVYKPISVSKDFTLKLADELGPRKNNVYISFLSPFRVNDEVNMEGMRKLIFHGYIPSPGNIRDTAKKGDKMKTTNYGMYFAIKELVDVQAQSVHIDSRDDWRIFDKSEFEKGIKMAYVELRLPREEKVPRSIDKLVFLTKWYGEDVKDCLEVLSEYITTCNHLVFEDTYIKGDAELGDEDREDSYSPTLESLGMFIRDKLVNLARIRLNTLDMTSFEIFCNSLVGSTAPSEIHIEERKAANKEGYYRLIADLYMKSSVANLKMNERGLSDDERVAIGNLKYISPGIRDLPIISSTKSAAKTS